MASPRKLQCTVAAITDHGGHVYTLDLVPTAPVPAFRPGQFLHLTVDPYDPSSFWPESRVFSIASSPRERNRIRLCYSVKGRYTTKMEQVLKVGGEVWIKLPYGDFVIDSASDAVLIAGGTGISAFTAFLEALTPEIRQKVTLVYGARTAELFLFQEMILNQNNKVPGFNVLFFAETNDTTFVERMATLSKPPQCFPGRIALDAILRPLNSDVRPPSSVICPPTPDLRPLISDSCPPSSVICPPTPDLRPPIPDTCHPSSVLCPLTSVFYLSGPPVMLKTLTGSLQANGVSQDRIRTDAWE